MTYKYKSWNGRKGYKNAPRSFRPNSYEIVLAMEKFKEKGGLIKKLQDQPTPLKNLVSPKNIKNFSPYESLFL
ncbi:MAG: hypothetical protein IIA85_00310 [Nanoarchaeota archaeon]|nr:hypothetical protein [Nanoarchaeota archaeon]